MWVTRTEVLVDQEEMDQLLGDSEMVADAASCWTESVAVAQPDVTVNDPDLEDAWGFASTETSSEAKSLPCRGYTVIHEALDDADHDPLERTVT